MGNIIGVIGILIFIIGLITSTLGISWLIYQIISWWQEYHQRPRAACHCSQCENYEAESEYSGICRRKISVFHDTLDMVVNGDFFCQFAERKKKEGNYRNMSGIFSPTAPPPPRPPQSNVDYNKSRKPKPPDDGYFIHTTGKLPSDIE